MSVTLLIGLLFISTAFAQTCTTTDILNVRSCAGTSCSVVGQLQAGVSVSLVSGDAPTANGHTWAQINSGWIARTYLRCGGTPAAPVPASGGQIVSAAQFQCMFPRVPAARVSSWMPYLNAALSRYGITSVARVQMFLAQTGHETDSYNTFSEYVNSGGTNAWCPRYNGGCRYRGRGAIQLTHQYNYQRAGNELGVNFVANPDIVATPQYAFEVGGLFWKWNNLNSCSDSRDMLKCTRTINGGTNGLGERKRHYSDAQRCITTVGSRAMGASDSTYTNSDSSLSLSSGASAAIIIFASILVAVLIVVTVMFVLKFRKNKLVEVA